MKILLTAASGPSGICFAKSLSDIDGVHIVGTSADSEEHGKQFLDVLYRVPLANEPAYLDTMRNIIAREGVDCVIPLVDEEMRILSEYADTLGCKVLVSPFKTISFTSDKGAMYDIAKDYLPIRFEKEAISAFPIFAKPKVGRGGKGTKVVENALELENIPAETYVFQELLQSPEVSIDAVFDFSGNLVAAVPRLRSEIDQGISISGRVFRDQQLLNIVKDLATRMVFIGPVNFQFMRGAGGYKLLEINARGSGGMGITIQSGVDVPKLAYELIATGVIETKPEMREGVYANFEEVLERQRRKKQLESHL